MAQDKSEELVSSIRRIIRAVDIHSRDLLKKHGMTGPQLVILKKVNESNVLSVSEIAKYASLSQATVTNILTRLEQQGYIIRQRGESDKRKVYIETSEKTRRILENNPSLLQAGFVDRFSRLKDWEQSFLVASLQRIAALMNAEDLDVEPQASTAPLGGTGGKY